MSNSQRTFSAVVGVMVATLATGPVAAQQRGAPVPPPGPTMEQSFSALAAARQAADAAGVKLSCAVVDSRGDLIALARMDGARFYTTDVARGKAALSAMFGQPSGNLGNLASSPAFANFNEAAQTPLYPFQGALPIMRDGETIGAMGCSGASSQQDEDAVTAALSNF
jgi:glc operon protein GlcG